MSRMLCHFRPAGFCAGLLLAVGLAGCATGPDYRRPDLALPDAWRFRDVSTNSLADMPYTGLYRDSVLNSLIATALSNSPDVRSALAHDGTLGGLRCGNGCWDGQNGWSNRLTVKRSNRRRQNTSQPRVFR